MTKHYGTREKPPPENPRVTNRDRVLSAFYDAGTGARLTGSEIERRTGVKNAYEYLSILASRGEIVRVEQGVYALPSAKAKAMEDEGGGIDERMAEDIRADERRRMLDVISREVADAIPKETVDWLRGYKDGAEAVLKAALRLDARLDLKAPD